MENMPRMQYNGIDTTKEDNGMSEEITSLYEELQQFGIVLQFVRSGRVAISTSCFERLNEYLAFREEKYNKEKEEK